MILRSMATLCARLIRREPNAPRDSLAHLRRLLEKNPEATQSQQLDAIGKGARWAREDPFLWERRAAPPLTDSTARESIAHGRVFPMTKIGRR